MVKASRVNGVCVKIRDRVMSYRLDLGLGLVVAAAYRPLVLRTSLIFYVLNANTDRQTDMPLH